jgi:hypothetical protein
MGLLDIQSNMLQPLGHPTYKKKKKNQNIFVVLKFELKFSNLLG